MNVHGSKWIRPEKRLAIYARDGFSCVYCGAAADELAEPFCLDHVLPRCEGGTHHESNLVTACRFCNEAKAEGLLGDFLATLEETVAAKTAARVVRQTRAPIDRAYGKALLRARRS